MEFEKVMIPIESLGIELEARYKHKWVGYTWYHDGVPQPYKYTYAVYASGEWAYIGTKYLPTKEEALADAINQAETWANHFLQLLRSDINNIDNAFKEVILDHVNTYENFGDGDIETRIYDDLYQIAIACYKKVLKEIS